MKALSLKPLWAILLVHALKRNETRDWAMKHRGVLLIHASGKVSALEKELSQQEPFKSALASLGITSWQQLPVGAILGQVEVTDCAKVDEVMGGRELIFANGRVSSLPGGNEVMFGDYGLGRSIVICQNHTAFKKPLPIKGQLSVWDVPMEVFNRLSVESNAKQSALYANS